MPPKPSDKKRRPLGDALPEVWALVAPRKSLLARGFALKVINRICGLILPGSTKFFIDDVITTHHYNILYPLVGAVLTATIVQGVTSYALTQSLSKAAQRLIAYLRQNVFSLISRLPFAYYDSNKSNTHKTRNKTDVE